MSVVVVVGEEHLRGNDRAGEVLEEHAKGSWWEDCSRGLTYIPWFWWLNDWSWSIIAGSQPCQGNCCWASTSGVCLQDKCLKHFHLFLRSEHLLQEFIDDNSFGTLSIFPSGLPHPRSWHGQSWEQKVKQPFLLEIFFFDGKWRFASNILSPGTSSTSWRRGRPTSRPT